MPKIGDMFKNAASVIESLTDNHKNPLHVGEAMGCWTYLAFVSNIIIYIEVYINMTTDPELKKLFQDSLKVTKSHKEEISQFMIQEGVPHPSIPEDKPDSNPAEVPPGVKFTESENINMLNFNFIMAADMCAAMASQSLRTDVALIFLNSRPINCLWV